MAASAKVTAEEEQSDAHFASLSQEQVIEEITGDDAAALRYAQYKARLNANAGGVSPQAIAKSSEVYSIGSQVKLNLLMLENSGLPSDVKETLKPENFNNPGGEGLTAWGEAIFKALVTSEAQTLAETLKESQWEAYKQEHLAETDGERPVPVGGRHTEILPDLIKTPTDKLWDGAFQDRKIDKKGDK